MAQIFPRLFAGMALVALPLTVLVGCGGGSSGGGNSGFPTPTPTATRTPIPTNTPNGQAFAIIAQFTNINAANVQPAFVSNSGEGYFSNGSATVAQGQFSATFRRTGDNTRQLNIFLTRFTNFVVGQSIPLSIRDDPQDIYRVVRYSDTANTTDFIARSGTLTITGITPVTGPSGQRFTRVRFDIRNAAMVSNLGIPTAETFTLNASGETTSPLPTG